MNAACKFAIQVSAAVHAYERSQDLQGDTYRVQSLVWSGGMSSNKGRDIHQRDMQLHVSGHSAGGRYLCD